MQKRKTNRKHLICQDCREAIRQAHHDYKKRRLINGAKAVRRETKRSGYDQLIGGNIFVDPTGTRRRLQALNSIGYGWHELGRRLGQGSTNVRDTAMNALRGVFPETAQKVLALYDELSMLTPEDTREKRVVLTWAARRGCVVGPLSWDEETIDDPYTLPLGLTHEQAYNWFWGCATMTERIEWVLENGLTITRKDPDFATRIR